MEGGGYPLPKKKPKLIGGILLLVRLPDVEVPRRGLLEQVAEQMEEGEQRAVPWESVVTKEFEDDAHKTKHQDKGNTIRVDMTLRSRTKRISGKAPSNQGGVP